MKPYYLFLFALVILIAGCSKDPTAPPVSNDHSPATTVILTLVRVNLSGIALDTTSCTVRDTSVIKGRLPIEGKLSLQAGSIYKGYLTLLDESQLPVKDITSSIIAEKDAHQFRFTVKENDMPSTAVVISDLDKDSKGLDFGLNFTATTGVITKPAIGAIHILLEHHDDGNKAGAQFDTDLNRDFPFELP